MGFCFPPILHALWVMAVVYWEGKVLVSMLSLHLISSIFLNLHPFIILWRCRKKTGSCWKKKWQTAYLLFYLELFGGCFMLSLNTSTGWLQYAYLANLVFNEDAVHHFPLTKGGNMTISHTIIYIVLPIIKFFLW